MRYTYTSQPGATDGIDTYLDNTGATTNHGTDNGMLIGHDAGLPGNICRGLLKFNLAVGTNPPPVGCNVVSATLTLTPIADNSLNARTLSAYRCLRNMVEGDASPGSGATWNTYDGSNNWGTAGAENTSSDREATAMGTLSVPAAPTLNTGMDMALDPMTVQNWIRGLISNYGMVLRVNTESGDQVTWASSDHATAGYRPKLTIVYELPSGIEAVGPYFQM